MSIQGNTDAARRPTLDAAMPTRLEHHFAREHIAALLAEVDAERLARGSSRGRPSHLDRLLSVLASMTGSLRRRSIAPRCVVEPAGR